MFRTIELEKNIKILNTKIKKNEKDYKDYLNEYNKYVNHEDFTKMGYDVISNVYNNMGYCHEMLGDENSSIKYYVHSLNIFETDEYYNKLGKIILKKFNQGYLLSNNSNKKICFYTGYTEPFDGKNYKEKKTIWGSEIAVIKIAESLSKYGYDVHIFCTEPSIASYNNVNYHNSKDWNDFNKKNGKIDVLIISRYINFFLDNYLNVDKIYLWIHDVVPHSAYKGNIMEDHGIHFIKNIQEKINKFICVSEWQRDVLLNLLEIDKTKFHVIGNGLDEENYEDEIFNFGENFENINKNRDNYKIIYCSDPSRGLDILLKMFPKLKEINNKISLDIYWNELDEETTKKVNILDDVEFKGKVSQKELAIIMRNSGIWFYTNTSHETFCMNALEAQRAGMICICRKFSGLITTVGKRGILIEGNPEEEKWQNEALNKFKLILNSDDLMLSLRKKSVEWSIDKTWKNRSSDWRNILEY